MSAGEAIGKYEMVSRDKQYSLKGKRGWAHACKKQNDDVAAGNTFGLRMYACTPTSMQKGELCDIAMQQKRRGTRSIL
jgi:hypothetical protein